MSPCYCRFLAHSFFAWYNLNFILTDKKLNVIYFDEKDDGLNEDIDKIIIDRSEIQISKLLIKKAGVRMSTSSSNKQLIKPIINEKHVYSNSVCNIKIPERNSKKYDIINSYSNQSTTSKQNNSKPQLHSYSNKNNTVSYTEVKKNECLNNLTNSSSSDKINSSMRPGLK